MRWINMITKHSLPLIILFKCIFVNLVYAADHDLRIVLPVKGGCTMESPQTVLIPNIELELLTNVAAGTALTDDKHVSFLVTAYCTSPEYTVTIVPVSTGVEDGCILPKPGLRLCLERETRIQTKFDYLSELGLSARFNRKINVDSQTIPFKIIPTRGNQDVDSGAYEASLMFVVDVL